MKNNDNLYLSIKEDGLFYLVLGSCISSDNVYTPKKCDKIIARLERFLREIPEYETEDRQRVNEALVIVRAEKDRCKKRAPLIPEEINPTLLSMAGTLIVPSRDELESDPRLAAAFGEATEDVANARVYSASSAEEIMDQISVRPSSDSGT